MLQEEKKLLSSIGVSSVKLVEGSIAALEDAISKLKEKYKNAATDKERKELLSQIKQQENLLSKIDLLKSSNKATESRRKALQDYEKSYIDVLSKQRKLVLEAEQAKIDAQKDGYEKSRAQLELNFKKEKDAIYQQQQDILKLYQDIEKSKQVG